MPRRRRPTIIDDLPGDRGRRPRRRRRSWVLLLIASPLLGLLVLPLAALLLRTPPAVLAHYLKDPATRQALWLSLTTSLSSLSLIIAFGTPLACVLVRTPGRGRSLLEVLIDLPTVLPPAVAGIALLLTFGRQGIIGQWLERAGVGVPFTSAAVVIAQTFVAAPYFVKAAAVGLAGVDEELQEAAALDGASPLQSFRHVTLPLAWRGFVGGSALCWARALGEFGATIIFAGNLEGRTQTMPLAVYIGFEIDLKRALTLAAILLILSFGLLLTVRATLGAERDG